MDTKIAPLCLGKATADCPVKAAEVPEPAGAEAKPEGVAEKLADSKLGVSASLDKNNASINPSSNQSISQPDKQQPSTAPTNESIYEQTNQHNV